MQDTTGSDKSDLEPTIAQQTTQQGDGICTTFWEGNAYIRMCPHIELLILAISSTGDPKSFAYSTSRERWPKILQNVIIDVRETIAACSQKEAEEGEAVIVAVEGLRKEILNDAVLE